MLKNEIKGGIKKYLEANDNENTTIRNLWDSTKAVLRGKLIAIQAFFKKQEKMSNNLTHHLKELEHQVQWIRLCNPNARGQGSISAQGIGSHMHAATKSSYATTKEPKCLN